MGNPNKSPKARVKRIDDLRKILIIILRNHKVEVKELKCATYFIRIGNTRQAKMIWIFSAI